MPDRSSLLALLFTLPLATWGGRPSCFSVSPFPGPRRLPRILRWPFFPCTSPPRAAGILTKLTATDTGEAFFRLAADVLSPESPILQTFADIPVAPGMKAHFIVAIDGGETPPEGDDGVVRYTGAPVDYVESEFWCAPIIRARATPWSSMRSAAFCSRISKRIGNRRERCIDAARP